VEEIVRLGWAWSAWKMTLFKRVDSLFALPDKALAPLHTLNVTCPFGRLAFLFPVAKLLSHSL
jgi:hypothetical protein